MTLEPLPSEVWASTIGVTPVGSRVTCQPAPTTTDADYLVLIHDCSGGRFEQTLVGLGWTLGGSLPTDVAQTVDPESRFWSYTKGEINLIVTENAAFHERFLAATSVAKRLNLLDKSDRIALFQAVLYGVGGAA